MRKYPHQDLARAVPARVRDIYDVHYMPEGKHGAWVGVRGWPNYGTLQRGNVFAYRGMLWRLGWQSSETGTIRVAKVISF